MYFVTRFSSQRACSSSKRISSDSWEFRAYSGQPHHILVRASRRIRRSSKSSRGAVVFIDRFADCPREHRRFLCWCSRMFVTVQSLEYSGLDRYPSLMRILLFADPARTHQHRKIRWSNSIIESVRGDKWSPRPPALFSRRQVVEEFLVDYWLLWLSTTHSGCKMIALSYS